MDVRKCLKGSGAFLSMLLVQFIATGLQILSKIIIDDGVFIFAFMTYRHIIAAVCIFPFIFFLERRDGKRVTPLACIWIFLSALTGITMGMGMFYYGMRDTNATYATNFLNLIPIVTFFFSTILGMEKLRLSTLRGKVKVAGAVICVGGALVISLYKGISFHIGSHKFQHKDVHAKETDPDWTRGTCFLVASCFSYATWFIVQVKLLKQFQSKYWATMLMCVAAAIQSAVVGLCIDRRKSSWKLGWNLQLLTIFYSGALVSGMSFYLISLAVAKKGPTYPAMFSPLCLVFVALLEFFFFSQDLALGSLLGMTLVILGLYLFLWGKKPETENPTQTEVGIQEDVKSGIQFGGLQESAIIVPTASPVSRTLEEGRD